MKRQRHSLERIWREGGLRVPAQTKKRRRLSESTTAADRLKAQHPNHGPELTAAGLALPEPLAEPFSAHMREELLNVEVLTCPEEPQVLAADWREDYNANHPHSALSMMSPERGDAQRAGLAPGARAGGVSNRGRKLNDLD